MSGWYNRLNRTSPSTSDGLQGEGEMTERGEPRAELDRQRHRHLGTHLLDELEVLLLHVGRAATRVDDDVVDVQLDGLRSCALEMAGVLHPPSRRRSVETGDHRDRELIACLLDQGEVPSGADVVVVELGQVAQRFGERIGTEVERRVDGERLSLDLLLEERRQNDRPCAGLFDALPSDGDRPSTDWPKPRSGCTAAARGSWS